MKFLSDKEREKRSKNRYLQSHCDFTTPSLIWIEQFCQDEDVHCFFPFTDNQPGCTAFEIALKNNHFFIADYFMENQRFQKLLAYISEYPLWNLPERILILFIQKNEIDRAKKFLRLIPNPITSSVMTGLCLSMTSFDRELFSMLHHNNPKIMYLRNDRNRSPFLIAIEKELFEIATYIIQEYEFEPTPYDLRKALPILRENHQDDLIALLGKKYPGVLPKTELMTQTERRPQLKQAITNTQNALELLEGKEVVNLESMKALLSSGNSLPEISVLFKKLVDSNLESAVSQLNQLPALHDYLNQVGLRMIKENNSWEEVVKKYYCLRGVPLFNGELLLYATRLNRMDIVDDLLIPWAAGNFLSKCAPCDLSQAASYLIQNDQLEQAKKLISLNSSIDKLWEDGSLLKSCIHKNVPDLKLVRMLYVESQSAVTEFKKTPIIPRKKILIILDSLQKEDLIADNLSILLKSYLADPKKKNSVRRLFSTSVSVIKIGIINKIINLLANRPIIVTPCELNYLIKSNIVDTGLLKKMIQIFYSMDELQGLRNAIDISHQLSESINPEIRVDQKNAALKEKKLECVVE